MSTNRLLSPTNKGFLWQTKSAHGRTAALLPSYGKQWQVTLPSDSQPEPNTIHCCLLRAISTDPLDGVMTTRDMTRVKISTSGTKHLKAWHGYPLKMLRQGTLTRGLSHQFSSKYLTENCNCSFQPDHNCCLQQKHTFTVYIFLNI